MTPWKGRASCGILPAMKVEDIRKGDQMISNVGEHKGEIMWTATARPKPIPGRPGFLKVTVVYENGEHGHRIWPEGDSLPLTRPKSNDRQKIEA